MNIKIEILNKSREQEYDDFILKDENTLLLSTLKYRDLIKITTESEPNYILAVKENRIVGTLPTFLKINNTYGNVLNSLPWYGGNPGISVESSLEYRERIEIKKQIILSFINLAKEKDCISSNLVTRPFEKDLDVYENNIDYVFKDTRIGMFTNLPGYSENIDDNLMKNIHSKTRNLIRKAQKINIECSHSNSFEDLRFLAETHKKNMEAVGATPKDLDFFINFSNIFEYDKDYRIYIAKLDDIKIGALLVVYFNKTVEYFTPAIDVEYRSYQPLNLLIFNAMKDMSFKGFKFWNWGGTTIPGMEGVYHFKKRWGSDECNYYYYITFYKDLEKTRKLNKEIFLKEYPFFYVMPFSEILEGEK